MKRVIVNGDHATGHTDILGNQIPWTISSSSKMITEWKYVSKSGDIVSFPSHPHALDWYWSPTNYRTHSISITWTGKLQVSGHNAVVDLNNVPVWDEAWWDATMQATQFKLLTS